MQHAESDTPRFRVVRNEQDQYSLWPEQRQLPAGWNEAGAVGSRDECLNHIRHVWTDPRPRSVRERGTADATQASSRGTIA